MLPDPLVLRLWKDPRVQGIRPLGDVRIFVREGDRWLLDDWFDLTSSSTPAAGMAMTEPTPGG